MKSLRNLMIVACLSMSLMSTTYTTTPMEESKDTVLRHRIIELVDQPQFSVGEDKVVKVAFQINDLNEIVVLDVKTDDATLAHHVSSRLNYKKTKLSDFKYGVTYYVDIRFN